MHRNFFSDPPHPETREGACTAPTRSAPLLPPAADVEARACSAHFAGEQYHLFVVPEEDPWCVHVFRGKDPDSLTGPETLCRLPAPVRSISACFHAGEPLLFAAADRGYFCTMQGEIQAAFPLAGEHATAFSDEDGRIWLLVDGARMAYDWDSGRVEHTACPITATPFRLNENRFDALYAQRRDRPGRGGSLAKMDGQYAYSCEDDFDRCGRENIDSFLCVSPSLDGPFSRRYLLIPSARGTRLFQGRDGEWFAVFIGSTPHSAVYRRPAIVRLSRQPLGFFRPDENFRYETGVVDRMLPVPNGGTEIRDPFITAAPDGYYYLTGTTARPGGTFWEDTNGIVLWRSKDLAAFEYVDLVYDYAAQEDTWQRRVSRAGNCWASEICFFDGTYWITYSTEPGCGLLKSVSGEPQGPYEDMGRVVMRGIDAGFFIDEGVLYLVWQNGLIAPFDKHCQTFTEEPRLLLPEDGQQVGYEGAGIIKIRGKYVLYAAEWNGDKRIDGTYDMMYSVSDHLYGPYTPRRMLVPHGGHGCLFDGRDGNVYFTLFGNDRTAPFSRSLGIGRLDVVLEEGQLILTPGKEA